MSAMGPFGQEYRVRGVRQDGKGDRSRQIYGSISIRQVITQIIDDDADGGGSVFCRPGFLCNCRLTLEARDCEIQQAEYPYRLLNRLTPFNRLSASLSW